MSAAGFDGYTQYAAVPIQQRAFPLQSADQRLVRFGCATAYAAEQAGLLVDPPYASAIEQFEQWFSELDTSDGGALLRFAARGLRLSAWLKDPAARISTGLIDDLAQELAQLADDPGLCFPARRSPVAAVREVRRHAHQLREWIRAIDDPTLQNSDSMRHFIWMHDGTLGDAIEVEVATGALYCAVAALADIYRDSVGTLIDSGPFEVCGLAPAGSDLRSSPLEQYLSLALVGHLDWRAAERHILGSKPGDAGQRRRDLAELSAVVAMDEYRRLTTRDVVGDYELFIAAPGCEPDFANALGRLGRGGVLDAAGVVWWSAPQPDGPQEIQDVAPGPAPRYRDDWMPRTIRKSSWRRTLERRRAASGDSRRDSRRA